MHVLLAEHSKKEQITQAIVVRLMCLRLSHGENMEDGVCTYSLVFGYFLKLFLLRGFNRFLVNALILCFKVRTLFLWKLQKVRHFCVFTVAKSKEIIVSFV